MVDDQRDRQQHDGRCRHLPGGGQHRRGAHPLETAAVDSGKGVGHSRCQHRELRSHVGAQACERVGADHHDHADEADDHAGEPIAGHLLIGREPVRHDHGPERRGGVEDRGEAGGDAGLAPDDETEGHDVVEETHGEKGAPRLQIVRHAPPDR